MVIFYITIVTLATAKLVGIAFEIVKLLPVIEVLKELIGLSLMSKAVHTGTLMVKLYCNGNSTII